MTELIVNVNKTIHAPIEKVFDAWLDPKQLSQFMMPMPGMPPPQTDVDPREGGDFTIIMQVGENKIPHTGTYLEISRPEKLVFTWMSPFSVNGSSVTLIFRDLGACKTKIELTHIKFSDEERRENHEVGWTNILQKQDSVLS